MTNNLNIDQTTLEQQEEIVQQEEEIVQQEEMEQEEIQEKQKEQEQQQIQQEMEQEEQQEQEAQQQNQILEMEIENSQQEQAKSDDIDGNNNNNNNDDDQIEVQQGLLKVQEIRTKVEELKTEMDKLFEIVKSFKDTPIILPQEEEQQQQKEQPQKKWLEFSNLRFKCSAIQEGFIQQLLTLDKVESFGNDKLRKERKLVSIKANEYGDIAEKLVSEALLLLKRYENESKWDPSQKQEKKTTAQPTAQATTTTQATSTQATSPSSNQNQNKKSQKSQNKRSTIPNPSNLKKEKEEEKLQSLNDDNEEKDEEEINSKDENKIKTVTPPAKLEDCGDHYIGIIDLPFVNLNEVQFNKEEKENFILLKVSGPQRISKSQTQQFEVKFKLPLNADINESTAKFHGKLLHISIPKIQTRRREVPQNIRRNYNQQPSSFNSPFGWGMKTPSYVDRPSFYSDFQPSFYW